MKWGGTSELLSMSGGSFAFMYVLWLKRAL